MDRGELGRRGEDAAAAYIERTGMQLVERNWRCKAGEIDLIAWDGPTLVLCEVKTRRSVARGTPEDAISPTKQKRIARLAATYVASLDRVPSVRFDAVTLLVLSDDRALLRHHRAAFEIA